MNSAEYNILEYGAVPGGNKINTKAVQAAVDTCAENGGGRVLVPGVRAPGEIQGNPGLQAAYALGEKL